MGWADQYIKLLETQKEISFYPKGNSMQPKIESGDKVVVKGVLPAIYRVGDIVLCKVKGKQYLHFITAKKKYSWQISNNKGFVNGWIESSSIYGICIQVKDKILLSKEEELKRFCEPDDESAGLLVGTSTKEYMEWVRNQNKKIDDIE